MLHTQVFSLTLGDGTFTQFELGRHIFSLIPTFLTALASMKIMRITDYSTLKQKCIQM